MPDQDSQGGIEAHFGLTGETRLVPCLPQSWGRDYFCQQSGAACQQRTFHANRSQFTSSGKNCSNAGSLVLIFPVFRFARDTQVSVETTRMKTEAAKFSKAAAYHEAGHAVAAIAFGYLSKSDRLTIVAKGEVLGFVIVSNSSSTCEGKSNGRCPFPLKALPVWVVQSLIEGPSARKMEDKDVASLEP